MRATRMRTIRHLIRAFIMAGFSYYISVLVKNRGIAYYIAPNMEIYVKLAAIALLVIAAYQGYLAIRSSWAKVEQDVHCDCGADMGGSEHTHHDHKESPRPDEPARSFKLKTLLVYGIFVFPLLMGFFLPDAALNSALAAKKGVNLSGAGYLTGTAAAAGPSGPATPTSTPVPTQGPATVPGSAAPLPTPAAEHAETAAPSKLASDAELDKLFVVENDYDEPYAKLAKKLYKQPVIQIKEEGFIETITVIDMFRDQLAGKKVELTGFVYREDDMKPDQFVVARFAIQCCSADGMPFGFVNEYPRAQTIAKDAWVKVTGTIGKTTYNENEIVKISVEKVSSIKAPASPYVYPNYDYVLNGSG